MSRNVTPPDAPAVTGSPVASQAKGSTSTAGAESRPNGVEPPDKLGGGGVASALVIARRSVNKPVSPSEFGPTEPAEV